MGGGEGVLDALGDAPAGRHLVPVLPCPVPHGLDLIRPDTGGFTTRCDRRVLCGVTRVPRSTYLAKFSREVHLEVRSVKTDPDVLDILGGAVEVVDEEGPGDGGHVDQDTRMA